MSNEQQQRREDCRRAVLAYLAIRSAVALAVASIRRGLSAEWDFDESEVKAAILFLESDRLVIGQVEKFGSTIYYQVTADGIRTHERS